MANIFDYLKWRGDLTFTQDPPNAVDALIFSGLAYVQLGGRAEQNPLVPITLREAAEEFFLLPDQEERVRVENDLNLLHEAARTLRFGMSRVCYYRHILIPEQDTQFGAVTFLLDDGSAFLAFRGTDLSLVGWKEDFNMSFQQTVPAQRLAVQYVREVAAEFMVPMRLGGHSKGGNLAVFAAARSAPMVQQGILEVYNNDGPGFTEYMMGDPGYVAMVPRIRTYVPQSSVIGMLLEHEEPFIIIKSTGYGLMQHDLYTWEVMGKEFLPIQELTEDSKFLNATLKAWFADMEPEDRNMLVDMMFTLLGTGGVDSTQEILHPKNLRNYIRTLGSNDHMRRVFSEEFQGLIEAARKTHAQLTEDREQKLLDEASEE